MNFHQIIIKCMLFVLILSDTLIKGQNLIKNPYFYAKDLNLSTASSVATVDKWICIPDCKLNNIIFLCQNSAFKLLWCAIKQLGYNQAFDLNSGTHRLVKQKINITSFGYYRLYIRWISPVQSTTFGSFNITVNNTKYWDCIVLSDTPRGILIDLQDSRLYNQGQIQIIFQLTSAITPGKGIFIAYAQFKYLGSPLFTQFANNIQTIYNNTIIRSYNNLPGCRIMIKFLCSSFRNIDRLSFYYFHKLNLTIFIYSFLQNIFLMSQQKNNIIQFLQQTGQFNIINQIYLIQNNLQTYLQKKYQYTDSQFLFKNSKGIGFISNNLDIYTLQLPFIICVHIVCLGLFYMTKKYKISKLVRKYYFKFIVLFMLYQGLIQDTTFYFIAESINIFSKNFSHKITNIFIIFTYFLVILYCFSILLWIRYHYKSKSRYFIQDYKLNLASFIIEMTESSIFPLIFGFVHILLINKPNIQLLCLLIIQFQFSILKIYNLYLGYIQAKLKIFSSLVSSFLRIFIIINLYYNNKYSINISSKQIDILNNISQYLIYSYVLNQCILLVVDSMLMMKTYFYELFVKNKRQFRLKTIQIVNDLKIINTRIKQKHIKIVHNKDTNIFLKFSKINKQTSPFQVESTQTKQQLKQNEIITKTQQQKNKIKSKFHPRSKKLIIKKTR